MGTAYADGHVFVAREQPQKTFAQMLLDKHTIFRTMTTAVKRFHSANKLADH
jgi:hypothetical protein